MNHFENYLNFKDEDLDRYVYRIIPEFRLIELFKNKENVLVSPRLWDDPFENFIMKSKIRFSNGEISKIGFYDDYFAQCWSFHKASDAMWRIYSPNKNGIRIRTTVKKLAESLSNNLGAWKNTQCFIGKVLYLPNKKMLNFANTVLTGLPNQNNFAHTLLVKRPAFKHENEIRLIYSKKENTDPSDIYSYPLDPHSVFDQMMLDPRLTKEEAKEMKKKIKTATSFTGPIKRSLLYAPPEDMVFNFG